jgi:hypothetical protein
VRHRHLMDTAFAAGLFCVFAALALLVLLTGAGAYRGIEADTSARFAERTCASFLAEKVRRCDAAGSVDAGRFGDSDALLLREEIDGVPYQTAVYCYQGKLMELFSEEGEDLPPESGTELLAASGLRVSREGNLLRIACAGADGAVARVSLYLRAGEGADEP